MTELEWFECPDWRDMFTFIEGRVSDRKLRLFAVACWRTAWLLLPDEGKNAVELAEQYADGYATSEELRAVRDTFLAGNADEVVDIINGQRYRRTLGGSATDANALRAANAAMGHSANAATFHTVQMSGQPVTSSMFSDVLTAEMAVRRRLLQDVVGPLVFRSVILDPKWLTSDVVALAEGIYQEKAFERLSILSDALEEAGCNDLSILSHLRDHGPHVRGCWVIDLILGKE